jgi:N-[(2S)-2-amino-2-carboxyethyl]-L-glutamate dehydrogenase
MEISGGGTGMRDGDILIVKGSEVVSLLTGRERDLIEQARRVYVAHALGESSLPHSTFLRFPNNSRDRIIALPAYLGGESQVAGIKWVSSFPGNLAMGLDRASAIVVLNSMQTGQPMVFLEGSVISAKRTAASAALAAQYLFSNGQTPRLGIIGCGPINFEILRFLAELWPSINEAAAYDLDLARTELFKKRCRTMLNGMEIEIVSDVKALFSVTSLVSFATTALQPYIFDLPQSAPGTVILHISLRDLAPQVILGCDNVVDDVDHLCRAQTSIHLAEQQVGHRDFIRCTLADIILGRAQPRKDVDRVAVFSPFGLGILDIAIGQLVYELAIEQGKGTIIDSFCPPPGLSQG